MNTPRALSFSPITTPFLGITPRLLLFMYYRRTLSAGILFMVPSLLLLPVFSLYIGKSPPLTWFHRAPISVPKIFPGAAFLFVIAPLGALWGFPIDTLLWGCSPRCAKNGASLSNVRHHKLVSPSFVGPLLSKCVSGKKSTVVPRGLQLAWPNPPVLAPKFPRFVLFGH